MATSSSSSTSSDWDVFLSFRIKDSRNKFTDHLYEALKRAGFRAYIDDKDLGKGNEIGPDLMQTIDKSRFSIVVFSKTYASSKWCLSELARIMKCRKKRGQIVLPVFYYVKPTDVCYRKRSFEEAFGQHDKAKKWRAALKQFAKLSGYEVDGSRHESSIINDIVERISNELKLGKLKGATKSVGIDSRSNVVKSLLNSESVDVRIVGIYGVGGIGKTTIATEVYNSIYNEFEGSSFLFKVREEFSLNHTTNLQGQLLSEILKRKDETISSSNRGVKMIEERLRNKKILLVLDDVERVEQIEEILGNPFDWLFQGSRIIITTRIKDLLLDQKYFQYEVEGLNRLESLWLFSINAFGKWLPEEEFLELSKSVVDYLRPYEAYCVHCGLESLWKFIIKSFNDWGDPYKEYSKRAVDYCGGIPLALEVLGSDLSVEKSVHVWKSKFEKLEKIPHQRIETILKISYDSLDSTQRKIFLDIACFFIGKDKNYITCVLNGCGFFAVEGINTLIKRCLLKIQFGMLEMHDLIRDMGRHIVVQESSTCGERSRVWQHEEVLDLLQRKMGTKAVEGLIVDLPQSSKKISTEAFREMNKLRLLQLNSVDFTGSYEHISKELRWLCWNLCPLESIPTSLHLGNVVTLDMPCSGLKQVWDEKKDLGKLKFLNLSHSHQLTKISNFQELRELKELILKDCPSLVEVDESITLLTELDTLNLENCENLENLPKISSVVSLNLSGCSKLVNAHVFAAYRTRQNPSGLRPACLTSLDLSWCNLSDDMIPNNLQNFPSLKYLNLEGNKFYSLPPTISLLTKLTSLLLSDCRRLNLLPKLPLSITELDIDGCRELKRLPKTNILWENSIALLECGNLVEIEGEFKVDPVGVEILKKLLGPLGFSVEESASNLRMRLMAFFVYRSLECPRVWPLQGLSEQGDFKNGNGIYNLFFPGSEIPSCWRYQSKGKSVTFKVPPLQGRKIQGFIICAVYALVRITKISFILSKIRITNKTKRFHHTKNKENKRFWSLKYRSNFFCAPVRDNEHMTWLSYWCFEKPILEGYPSYDVSGATRFRNSMEEGDEVVVDICGIDDVVVDICGSPDSGEARVTKKCGIYIVYEQNEQACENSQEQQHVDSHNGSLGYEEYSQDDHSVIGGILDPEYEEDYSCPFHGSFQCWYGFCGICRDREEEEVEEEEEEEEQRKQRRAAWAAGEEPRNQGANQSSP